MGKEVARQLPLGCLWVARTAVSASRDRRYECAYFHGTRPAAKQIENTRHSESAQGQTL
jgi:hypothetical protein